MVPGNIALTLFAVTSGDRAALRSKVRMGLLLCLGLGLPVSLAVAAQANPIMSIFGEAYATTAGDALAILALTYLPFVFHHFFLAISRVQGRIRGAGIFSIFAGITELVAAYWGGSRGSLTELVWWVAAVMAVEMVLVAPIVLRVVLPERRTTVEGIMRSRRMTLRERVWLPLEYIRTVGPLTGVTADSLRAALIGLHAADPTHPAVSRLDRDTARWLHLDHDAFVRYVADAVTEVTGADADPDAMSRRLQAEPRAHHPVRMLVGGGYVAVKVAHVYGDAGPVNVLVRELIRAAAEERPASFTDDSPQRPLRRGLIKLFALHPVRLRRALRLAAPPVPGTEDAREWQADLTVRTARSAEALRRMRQWRDEHAPGTTTAAITFAAFTGALARLGLDPDRSGGVYLFDARRYVPDGGKITGNFCWGQYLSPADLTDPKAVHDTLKAELATGRILAMMGVRETRIALSGASGWPEPYPQVIGGHPRPRLTFSNQGRHDLLADLPWAVQPADRVNHSVPTLAGPEAVTITTSEMGGVLHLEATFHASTYDPALIERALELVCADPAALVSSAPAETVSA
jgi:hypothetical protein